MRVGAAGRAALVAVTAAVTLTSACTATGNAPPTAGRPVATPIAGPVPSAADIVARVTPSVVTVRSGSGVGSGVVYRPDVILTNAHVVGDATDVVVDLADGTSARGRVLATDAVTDLAVVRTERGGLPVPEYCPELPRPGAPVLAIGSRWASRAPSPRASSPDSTGRSPAPRRSRRRWSI